MKTTQYKKGVLEVVSRAREFNPQIGTYLEHRSSGPDHFNIRLSNGTLTLPRQVAYSQQEFPPHVPREWVEEIANTFEEELFDPGKQSPGLFKKLRGIFRGGK